MSTVERIEASVQQFSAEEFAAFARWFDEYRAAEWDKEIERDTKAGKLDKLADEALEDFRAGNCTPFP